MLKCTIAGILSIIYNQEKKKKRSTKLQILYSQSLGEPAKYEDGAFLTRRLVVVYDEEERPPRLSAGVLTLTIKSINNLTRRLLVSYNQMSDLPLSTPEPRKARTPGKLFWDRLTERQRVSQNLITNVNHLFIRSNHLTLA